MKSSLFSSIRRTAVAGVFYPNSAIELNAFFNQWQQVKNSRPGHFIGLPRAIIVPHAGYIYSGEAAYQGFALWQDAANKIKTLVVIGPAHRVGFEGIATMSDEAVATPLGNLALDLALRDQLLSQFDEVGVLDAAHAPEHSLEVQFPFIKHFLPEVKVLPLLNGFVSSRAVAEVLNACWQDPSVYFVISSDLSHFHPYLEAQAIDAETAKMILTKQVESLNGERACGYKGVQGLLALADKHPFSIEQLALYNSGDSAGSPDSVVGYGCWAIYEEKTDD